MVGLTASGPVGDAFTTELKRHGVVINGVVSNQTFYIAAALTGCGAGITVADELTARAGTEASVRFRPLDPPIRFKVECVFLEDRPPSQSAEVVIAMITATNGEIRPQAGELQRT